MRLSVFQRSTFATATPRASRQRLVRSVAEYESVEYDLARAHRSAASALGKMSHDGGRSSTLASVETLPRASPVPPQSRQPSKPTLSTIGVSVVAHALT